MVRPDRDRAQVYACESAAFDGTDLERVLPIEQALQRGRDLVAGGWWPGGPVAFRTMRADARSSVTTCGASAESTPTVAIARSQATIAIVAHELAHVLAGVSAGHGARFRRADLDVVHAVTNLDRVTARGTLHVDQLQAAYEAAGLAIADRTWPAPTAAGPIAL